MARTPLFACMRRLLKAAAAARHPHAPPARELVERARAAAMTRRQLLRSAAALAAGAGMFSGCAGAAAAQRRPQKGDPRIAVIGAGLAGLRAACLLRQAGLHADIYDAAARTGGRIYSVRDLLAPGLTTELGAEFIDSTHADMLELVRAFALELLDTQAPTESGLVADAFFFGGRHISEAEVLEAFSPLAARIVAAATRMDELEYASDHPEVIALDRTPLAAYLESIGARGWLYDLLAVAYTTEYGLDAERQSALNLIALMGAELGTEAFHVFGESDERFKIAGGNQTLVDRLAAQVEDRLHRQHRLEAVVCRGGGYRLTLQGPGGQTVERDADIVLLTLPFSLLREVDLRVPLPPAKRRAIDRLAYGHNAKLLLGFTQRPWRARGYSGNVYSDEAFQLAWDNSRLQPATAGGMTLYSGGNSCDLAGAGTPMDQQQRLLPGLDQAFPGVMDAFNGQAHRFHWPTHPTTKGSYSAYETGQWTTIRGHEATPAGNLFFAGEHCSLEFQGFMNGAAETGRLAARAIIRRAGIAAPMG